MTGVKEYYPPPAFYFTVRLVPNITSLTFALGASRGEPDSRFQEVSGIETEWEVELVVEGGENRYAHPLPTRAKHGNLVLKRGAVTYDTPLFTWAATTLGSSLNVPVTPQNLQVLLLGETGSPLIGWTFVNAYPVKWDVASLDATRNEALIESMEFAYAFSWRHNLGTAA